MGPLPADEGLEIGGVAARTPAYPPGCRSRYAQAVVGRAEELRSEGGGADRTTENGAFALWADDLLYGITADKDLPQTSDSSVLDLGSSAGAVALVSAANSLGPVQETTRLPSADEFRKRWRNQRPVLVSRGLACPAGWGTFAQGWADTVSSDMLRDAMSPEVLVACFEAPTDGRTFLKLGGFCSERALPWRDAVATALDEEPKHEHPDNPGLQSLNITANKQSRRTYTRANLSNLARRDQVALGALEEAVGGAVFKPELCGVWVSSPGCITPLHFDLCHGWLCQTRGRKRVLLAEPASTRSLYLRHASDANPLSSQVDVFRWLSGEPAQRCSFPKVAAVDWHEVILHPGQALYIPPLWWHAVETLDETSVSVLLPFDPLPGEIHHPCGALST